MSKIEQKLENYKLIVEFRDKLDSKSKLYATKTIEDIVIQYKESFDRANPYSEISKFNDSIELYEGNNIFFDFLTDAIYWFGITDGIFNPFAISTIQEDFSGIKKIWEGDDLFKLSNINYDFPQKINNLIEYLEIDYINKKVKFLRPLKIDLSGISKGILVDLICKELHKSFDDYSISFGGDKFFKSRNNESSWSFEFKSTVLNFDSQINLEANNEAISISGNIGQNDFIDDLSKYTLIDPISHKKLNTKRSIVIVKADNCTTSDVLAKAFLIGSEETRKRLSAKFIKISRFEIDENGKVSIY